MPYQEERKKSVSRKLNILDLEFKDKNVLLVDDSIVRGTTSKKIIEMVRSAGAKKSIFLPQQHRLLNIKTFMVLICLQPKS